MGLFNPHWVASTLLIFVLLSTAWCYEGSHDTPLGSKCYQYDDCVDPPKNGTKLYKHCAVASYDDFLLGEFLGGFCFYSQNSKSNIDYIYIGKEACRKIEKQCKYTTDCCKGLSCICPSVFTSGTICHCKGEYDEKYAKKQNYPKNPKH